MSTQRTVTAAISFAGLACGLFAATPALAQSNVGVTINGTSVGVEPAPIIENGRVFVPLRSVFQQLGASVDYQNGQINATQNSTEVSLNIGSTAVTVNGSSETIDVAPFIVGASTYVPLRFISQALGASVSWDQSAYTVAIATSYGTQNSGNQNQNGYQNNAYQANQNQNNGDYADTAPNFYESGYDVNEAPPPLPAYDQPPVPEPNDIWQPGCWAWSPAGYYWVPGTWVQPPQPNLFWTPGYWSFSVLGIGFGWHPGYWGQQVGFYGGVNYGGGYGGQGYEGGRWDDGNFHYNRAASNVDTTIIKNTYIYNKVVTNNYNTTTINRISYNGGPRGVVARPTAQQLSAARETHVAITPAQRQHALIASQDRRLLATVNEGRPVVTAIAHPFTEERKPANFAPITPQEKISAQAAAQKMIVRRPVAAPAEHLEQPTRPIGRPATAPIELKRAAPVERVTQPVRPENEPENARPESQKTAPPEHIAEPKAEPARPVAPVTHPAIETAPPAYHAAPVDPEARPRPVAPIAHPAAPVYHPEAPVYHPVAPVVHPAAPILHPAVPVYHPAAPAYHPAAPAYHPAPVHPAVVPHPIVAPHPAQPHPATAPHPAHPQSAPHPADHPHDDSH